MATTSITPDQDAVLAEIFIAAPPERVFQAITDPNQTPQWWGQQGMYRVTEWKADLRLGGKWSSVGVDADGSSFRVEGVRAAESDAAVRLKACPYGPPRDQTLGRSGAEVEAFSADSVSPESASAVKAQGESTKCVERGTVRFIICLIPAWELHMSGTASRAELVSLCGNPSRSFVPFVVKSGTFPRHAKAA